MKTLRFILPILLLGFVFKINGQETLVKGKVHNWISDSVYITSLPFYSPYSCKTSSMILSSDSTFEYSFSNINEPFVFFITPEKKSVNQQIQTLLFDNLTDKHYYGNCIKTYTYGVTTYLIEPGENLDLELTFNSWTEKLSDKDAEKWRSYGVDVKEDNSVMNIGKTNINFLNPDNFKYKYYQTSFNLDDKCDKVLEHSKKIKSGMKNLKAKEEELLSQLNNNKDKISPFLYEYIKAEIVYGAKKEFLKYLRFEHEKYMSTLFANEIPSEYYEITEFDKENINYATLINEEYNEYLEIYLNYKYSIEKKEYVVYKQFDIEKYDFALKELPEISKYYYLANNLLQAEKSIDFKNLADRLITDYPDGELNNKLIEKYQ
jgi:hypothetical protein